MSDISVILCTWNPDKNLLTKVIESLKAQTLSQRYWELIIIDNKSNINVDTWLDLSWHEHFKIVREENAGLIFARIKGTLEAKNEILVSVDDDTTLAKDYLEHIRNIYSNYPNLGIIGGQSFPIFKCKPPSWIKEFYGILAIRTLGKTPIIEKLEIGKKITHYPRSAPLLIAPRKSCMLEYIDFFNKNSHSKHLGRRGHSLTSGEDNDINLFIYGSGFAVGYFPQLKFYHHIPESRLNVKYLSRLVFSSSVSWVKVLENHHINPWKKVAKWSLPLRNLKSWFSHKAWKNEVNYIKWKGATGTFKGLSDI